MTLSEFVLREELALLRGIAASNPNMEMPEGTHYLCRIYRRKSSARHLDVPFSMGSAHKAPPTIVDVLSCLRTEAQTVEDARSFEDWANELGFDPDSRKAERTYTATRGQSAQLRAFLGEAAYSQLLFMTEEDA